MANIPGISGYIQPGAFARDSVISKAVSIPGGLRIMTILGEGLREEVIVEAARGGGLDGSATCSPTGTGDGRYFTLQNSPVISGRTELYLNGTRLYGAEDAVDETDFSSKYDFRLDVTTGCIELQKPSIADQGGKLYSLSTLNVGSGKLATPEGRVLTQVLDTSAPAERWTLRCVSVVKDSSGAPIPGRATFSATGSKSGTVYDSSGNAILFHSSYFSSSTGFISGSASPSDDGYVLAISTDFANGTTSSDGGDTPLTTNTFVVPGNLVELGTILPGDTLVLPDSTGIIESMSYNSADDETTIVTAGDTLEYSGSAVAWSIKAIDLFADEDATFKSSDIGKILFMEASGIFSGGKYLITKVTSPTSVRVVNYDNQDVGLPELAGTDGVAADSITYYLVETNGIIMLGIEEGLVPFEVGDRIFVDVKSKTLAANDKLTAKYIYEGDLNDPELFTDPQILFQKHGIPSETNTLSLAAQIAFENGAPGIVAMQCKPALTRRTSATLVPKRTAAGVGGFTGCSDPDECGVDDLRFVIPRPISSLLTGKPDSNSRVNIFVNRSGKETQIFPNKFEFYSSNLETDAQQLAFIQSSDNPYSYTIVYTNSDIFFSGVDGSLTYNSTTEDLTFESSVVDFDSTHVEKVIVITAMELSDGTVLTDEADIVDALYGTSSSAAPQVLIADIVSDSKVVIDGIDDTLELNEAVTNIQFYVKDPDTDDDRSAAILFHKDLYASGAIADGDGIRITYVDQADADFYDTNWFEAFEKLEAIETQLIVPVPTENISAIFKMAVSHCENMSTIANRKERFALIGAQRGITPGALADGDEVAVENLGVIEGIQGDDALEVLSGDIEDLANYKLSDNYNSNRVTYLYPDSIVRNIAGSNVEIHGFYMAPAVAGLLSATQNVAIPITNKVLTGFTIPRTKAFRPLILNKLGGAGATVVQPIPGGGKILAGRTCSQSGFVEDEEISVVFIRDRVKQVLRASLQSFIGNVQGPDTISLMASRTKSIMIGLTSQGLISSFSNIRVARDKVDPRQLNVYVQFTPVYPINYVFIDIEVGIV